MQCALAKLSYLLSKPNLTPAQVRTLISRPLRGELSLPSSIPIFANPVEAGDRLRTLFGLVLECSPATAGNNPGVGASSATGGPGGAGATGRGKPRQKSGSDSAVVPGVAPLLPAEFAGPWPATRREADDAERAVLPFLIGQASARHGPMLESLVESLKKAQRGEESMLGGGGLDGSVADGDAPAALSQLNEPATAAGQTSLHLAVLSAQPANVELLLAHGASVHTRDVLGHTPLYYAARQGASGAEMVRALREAGAHLGEMEIERGDVGLEIARADEEGRGVWREAAGGEYERAGQVLRALLG